MPAVVSPVILVVREEGLEMEYVLGPETFDHDVLAIVPSESVAVPVTETELVGRVIDLSTPALAVGAALTFTII